MKVVERYILKEVFPYFLLANLFFIFLLLLDKILDLSELFFSKGRNILLILEMLFFYMPSFLVLTIPTAMLLSTIIAFNRLNSDSEVVVLKSSGASNRTFVRPLILFSLLGLFMSAACSLFLSPLGNNLAWNSFKIITHNVTLEDLSEKQLYDKIPGLLIYVDKKMGNREFKGLLIYNKNSKVLILAKYGTINNNDNGILHFDLKNGSIIKDDKEFTHIGYKDFKVDFSVINKLNKNSKDEIFMGPLELLSAFNKSPIYKFQFASNFALSFATIIMVLYGFILGNFLKKYSKSTCVFFSFLIIMIYNSLFVLFKSLIYETFNPFLAAWMPNILFMCILPLLFFRRKL
jgi:lipopolysaccharide export system permease protein